jgi:hypothetical protein
MGRFVKMPMKQAVAVVVGPIRMEKGREWQWQEGREWMNLQRGMTRGSWHWIHFVM